MRTLCTCVESQGQWSKLPALPFVPVGFGRDEALLPTPPRQDDSLRLLAEYFAFPDKFDFVDIDLKAVLARSPAGARSVVLHLLLPDLHRTNTPDLLRMLPPTALRVHCTPVINLYSRPAAPIRVRAGQHCYPLALAGTGEAKPTVYAVDAMQLHGAQDGGGSQAMRWFFERGSSHCWQFELADADQGLEDTVSFVDDVGEPLALGRGTVDVQVTCTNGDVPSTVAIGRPGGNLASDCNLGGRTLRMLREPSLPHWLATGRDGHWQAIAAAHEHHRERAQSDLPALLSLLQMHARPESAIAARQLAGILGVSRKEDRQWIKFRAGASLVWGHEVALTIDEAAFTERSIAIFAQVMERVLAYYLTSPRFLCLNVLGKDGVQLVGGAPRLGSQRSA